MNATRLRISLAIATLAGAFHLDPAQADAPPRQDSCVEYAVTYATVYCNGKKARFSEVTYSCNPDGTANIHSVSCVLPT